MERVVAIGDIHGCSTALRSLLDAITPATTDTIILLGDVIDRGPDSRNVIKILTALACRCKLVFVRGNHEELLLNALDDAAEIPRWLRIGGRATLASYGCETPSEIPGQDLEFIRSSVDFYEDAENIFLHAGYVENLELSQQPALALRWRVTHDKTLPHCSGKVVVAGHTPQKSGKVLNLKHVLCIDTNCVHGGWLTAVDMATGNLWQANNQGETRIDSIR